MNKLSKYIIDENYRFNVNDAHGLYRKMPDEKYLKRKFKAVMGYELDLDSPKTYNEKLQWLKLNDRKHIYTTMVDKYEAKEYVARIIGEDYIIPSFGVWDSFDKIDFDALPNQFVLKCTHDSGGVVICRDKTKWDLEEARKKITTCLRKNYYYKFREWPYKDVKPRVLAEQYMEDPIAIGVQENPIFHLEDVRKALLHQNCPADIIITNIIMYDYRAQNLDISDHIYNDNELDNKTLQKIEQIVNNLLDILPNLRISIYEINGESYFCDIIIDQPTEQSSPILGIEDDASALWIKLSGSHTGKEKYICMWEGGSIYLHRDDLIITKKRSDISDYKIYTFNGKALLCMINQDRSTHTKADYFDRDYNWLDFTWGYDHADIRPHKPKQYEKMFQLAERLSANTTELRVDFYQVCGRIYFGELTFFDGSGFDKINPIEWDYKLGSYINLPVN